MKMKRTIYLITILILVTACFDEEAEVEEIVTEAGTSETPDSTIEHGVIASFNHERDEEVTIWSFPLYESPVSSKIVDSLYYLRHMGIGHGFYYRGEQMITLGPDGAILTVQKEYDNEELIMPAHGDYFNFYVENHLMQSLVYTHHIDNRYKVLNQTTQDGLWLDLSSLPDDFAPFLWHEFFASISLDEIEVVAQTDSLKLFADTAFEKEINHITTGQEAFYKVLEVDSIFFKVARFEVKHWGYTNEYEEYPWAYRPFYDENVDTGWIQMIEHGVPVAKLDIDPLNKFNSVFGIGMVSGGYGDWGAFRQFNEDDFIGDTLFYYDQAGGKKIGYKAARGKEKPPYFEEVQTNPNIQHNIGRGYDENWGLVSWEYTRVYEVKNQFLRIMKGTYDSTHQVWVKKNELIYDHKFYTFKQYYLHWLNGNAGWSSGYAWIGGYDYLYTEPDSSSKRVIELPAQGAIFLTGETKGNWAEAKFKEVSYMPGCGDIHEDDFYGRFHTWKGWVRMVDKDGHPNLDEIILGC